MTTQKEKYYISMLSDYGFKRAFGNKTNTLFLRTSLKALLGFKHDIVSVEFRAQEHTGKTLKSRAGIVDIACTDEKGTIYIIEMQRLEVDFFIHRLKLYAFQEYEPLVKKGKFKFDKVNQNKIYTVSFLEHTAYSKGGVRQVVNLRNEQGHLIDDQMTHIIIQLAEFDAPFEALKTDLDKLLYIMKYTDSATKESIEKAKQTPEDLWIEQMLQELELSNMTPQERANAERALAREAFAMQAEMQRRRKAVLEDRKKMANTLLDLGDYSVEKIRKIVKMTKKEFDEILAKRTSKDKN